MYRLFEIKLHTSERATAKIIHQKVMKLEYSKEMIAIFLEEKKLIPMSTKHVQYDGR